jgi:two-component system, OmpR family, KDP operon response regulator KdpE
MRILLVDDDRELIDLLAFALKRAGLEPIGAYDAASALRLYQERSPDLVVLDINLGASNGLDVLREVRRRGALPVIMLTALDSEEDKVRGLEAGADDYLTKPFDMEELLARLRAALRRDDRSPGAARFTIGRCEIDLTAHTIVRHRRPDAVGAGPGPPDNQPPDTGPEQLHLTPTEWRLLEILLNAPGQLVSSDRLLGEVWGPGYERSTHYLRFHMAGLRRKLEDDPHRPRHLLTEPGMGYRYQP